MKELQLKYQVLKYSGIDLRSNVLFTVDITINQRQQTDGLTVICCFPFILLDFIDIKIFEISHKNPDFCFVLIIGCFDHIKPAVLRENGEL